MNDDQDILTQRLTLPQLADKLGRCIRWATDMRRADPRFPKPDADGRYSVASVLCLLRLRQLERQSDQEFDAEESAQRQALARDMAEGGALGFVGEQARARVSTLPPRTRSEAIEEATADFQQHNAPRGRKGRSET